MGSKLPSCDYILMLYYYGIFHQGCVDPNMGVAHSDCHMCGLLCLSSMLPLHRRREPARSGNQEAISDSIHHFFLLSYNLSSYFPSE